MKGFISNHVYNLCFCIFFYDIVINDVNKHSCCGQSNNVRFITNRNPRTRWVVPKAQIPEPDIRNLRFQTSRDEFLGKEVKDIVVLAQEDDSEPWVKVVADMLSTYADNGLLNLDLDEDHHQYYEIIAELRKSIAEADPASLLPLECQYLNKNALQSIVGPQLPPVKHFALKRKPKSAVLRNDLFQKAQETQANQKRLAAMLGSGKMKPVTGKRSADTPLKGLPNSPFTRVGPNRIERPSTGGSSVPPNRLLTNRLQDQRERGTKMLEISEQPIGRSAAAKRKLRDDEEQQRKKKELAVVVTTDTNTPDYAVSLSNLPPPPTPSMPNLDMEPPTPSYVPVGIGPNNAAREQLTQQLNNQLTQTPATPTTPVGEPPLTPGAGLKPEPQPRGVGPAQVRTGTTETPVPSEPGTGAAAGPTHPGPSRSSASSSGGAGGGSRTLQLSKESLFEAQALFKKSNKLTRPEKALILGFMAGSRENPCKEQGDVITILLSEDTNDDSDQITDTYFEMDYQTGQWRTFQRTRQVGLVKN